MSKYIKINQWTKYQIRLFNYNDFADFYNRYILKTTYILREYNVI